MTPRMLPVWKIISISIVKPHQHLEFLYLLDVTSNTFQRLQMTRVSRKQFHPPQCRKFQLVKAKHSQLIQGRFGFQMRILEGKQIKTINNFKRKNCYSEISFSMETWALEKNAMESFLSQLQTINISTHVSKSSSRSKLIYLNFILIKLLLCLQIHHLLCG